VSCSARRLTRGHSSSRCRALRGLGSYPEAGRRRTDDGSGIGPEGERREGREVEHTLWRTSWSWLRRCARPVSPLVPSDMRRDRPRRAARGRTACRDPKGFGLHVNLFPSAPRDLHPGGLRRNGQRPRAAVSGRQAVSCGRTPPPWPAPACLPPPEPSRARGRIASATSCGVPLAGPMIPVA